MNVRVHVTANTHARQRGLTASKAQKPAFSPATHSPIDQVLQLQRTIGNRAVQRLIKLGAIQQKIKIGQPNNKYAQKTDQVAEQVMRMSENIAINGQSLPRSDSNYFKSRFGFDLSQVRIHTDSTAADTASSVNAKAFTIGKDVVFEAGQYSSEMTTGQHLFGHKSTYMVQQYLGAYSKINQKYKIQAKPRKSKTKKQVDEKLVRAIVRRLIRKMPRRLYLPQYLRKFEEWIDDYFDLMRLLNREERRRVSGRVNWFLNAIMRVVPKRVKWLVQLFPVVRKRRIESLVGSYQKTYWSSGWADRPTYIKRLIQLWRRTKKEFDKLPRAFRKYLNVKDKLNRELKQIRATRNKDLKKKRQIKFLKRIYNQIFGSNPFAEIDVVAGNRIQGENAVTDWKDRNRKLIKVTFNKDVFTDPLESIITSCLHESVHAHQLRSGVPYRSRVYFAQYKHYLNTVRSLSELDAYTAAVNSPFFQKLSKPRQKFLIKKVKNYEKEVKDGFNKMVGPRSSKKFLKLIKGLFPKFTAIQAWLKQNPPPF